MSDLDRFYSILRALQQQQGGPRRLADCDARSGWPKRGVYFFFEPGELRAAPNQGEPRVVRVGTHAVSANSGTTLWDRLKQHKGRGKPGDAAGDDEPITFLGGKDYVPLFCRLTQSCRGERQVHYSSAKAADAPGCKLVRFITTQRTNWHYSCAEQLVGGNR